jgi:7-cyano-7-deazaguanine reductase
MQSHSDHLKQLGGKSEIPASPETAILETIPFKVDTFGASCAVRFTVPEFTSLCPKTGQPDFALFVIDYVPMGLLVESKALKLFMHSFRNHGAFHEDVSRFIGEQLVVALQPHWLRIAAFWYPRGGIPIDVLWEYGSLTIPDGPHMVREAKVLPLPEHPYRGR